MCEELKDNIYRQLLGKLNNGEKAVVITSIRQGKKEMYCLTEKQLLDKKIDRGCGSEIIDNALMEKAIEAIETGNLQVVKGQEQDITLVEPYFPEPRLVVMGGGHIAKPLIEFADKVGFKVTVVDDRPSFANTGRFPLAEKVICESFEKSFSLLSLNNSAFIVILTRGHRHDMLCLKETLKYDTAYVGMIGSKRRVKIVKEELLTDGYTEEQIQKLNAPIGLDIGAVTPEEIAISILAQIISYKRKNKNVSDNTFTKANWPEFDPAVIEELARDNKEPKAIATIISAKGSVPRKAGAKMLVFSDGRTLGSIGGGCSEGEVILVAQDIIKNGGYLIRKVDMTGDVAEDEGMVCGGILEVLIYSI